MGSLEGILRQRIVARTRGAHGFHRGKWNGGRQDFPENEEQGVHGTVGRAQCVQRLQGTLAAGVQSIRGYQVGEMAWEGLESGQGGGLCPVRSVSVCGGGPVLSGCGRTSPGAMGWDAEGGRSGGWEQLEQCSKELEEKLGADLGDTKGRLTGLLSSAKAVCKALFTWPATCHPSTAIARVTSSRKPPLPSLPPLPCARARTRHNTSHIT